MRLPDLGHNVVDGDGDVMRRSMRGGERDVRHLKQDRVSKILDKMSLEEKIGQMSQIDIQMLLKDDGKGGKVLDENLVEHHIGELGIGSVLNMIPVPTKAEDYRQAAIQIQTVAKKHNRPPVIWGLDSVHGANYIHGASIPPQPLNMAATFNTTVAYQAGELASRDTRAAGINWLFSPLLGIALEPRWSRVYETFGEDPVVVGSMASQMIAGIQKDDATMGIPSKAAACAKHFVGYSMPHNGHDRSPSWIPTRHLYQYFVPPWKAAVKENVLTVMESYTETDGVPNVANPAALNYLLRQRLGFEGVLVTDYEEIRNLHSWHHISASFEDATVHTLLEGSVDMSMIPKDPDGFRQGVLQGLGQQSLSEHRLNQSVERVLRLKEELRMWDEELQLDDPNLALIGQDRDAVLDMTHQSLVLTKNEGMLPLEDSRKILVTGPTADSLIYQSGGWTWQWQGAPNKEDWFTYGTSVLDAFRQENDPQYAISYSCGVDVLGHDCPDADTPKDVVDEVEDLVGLGPSNSIERAVKAAEDVDVVVVCVGEEAYAEKPGDIRSLDLPHGQYDLVKALKDKTDAKIMLVYFGGRPRLLKNMVEQADAVIVGFLPGPDAGKAVVDIVNGRVNPSGRLPVTYPLYDDGGGVPYFHSISDQCTRGDGQMPHYEYGPCQVQWPFGHGLSYTSFEYSDLTASGGIDRDLKVSVKVKNTGSRPGSEAVMFFTFDEFRLTTPEYKRLRSFEKVHLDVGEEVTVSKSIPADELRFIGPHNDRHGIQDPEMRFYVGVGASTDCRTNGAGSKLCIYLLEPDKPDKPYIAACDAACELWTNSGCAGQLELTKHACLDLCMSISQSSASSGNGPNEGWGWNYVECIESVVWGFKEQTAPKECWKMTSICRDIFQTGQLDEFGIGTGGHVPPPPSEIYMDRYIALLAGLLSAVLIVYGFRRKTSDENAREEGFAMVNTEID